MVKNTKKIDKLTYNFLNFFQKAIWLNILLSVSILLKINKNFCLECTLNIITI